MPKLLNIYIYVRIKEILIASPYEIMEILIASPYEIII